MIDNLKAYIVEDNEMYIEILKMLLERYYPNISIIGEAANTKQLTDLLISNQADLIFLDIELGEQKTSLDILKEFKNISAEIIITSSSKEYALKALNDHNITSYVLKPIEILNFNKAIRKVEDKINKKNNQQSLPPVSDILADNVIAIPTITTLEIVNINDIFYLEADGKYTIFHLKDNTTKIVSKNIGYYDNILPKNVFFRIHHKYTININKAESLIKTDNFYCLLKNGMNLPISKRRIEELRKFLYLK